MLGISGSIAGLWLSSDYLQCQPQSTNPENKNPSDKSYDLKKILLSDSFFPFTKALSMLTCQVFACQGLWNAKTEYQVGRPVQLKPDILYKGAFGNWWPKIGYYVTMVLVQEKLKDNMDELTLSVVTGLLSSGPIQVAEVLAHQQLRPEPKSFLTLLRKNPQALYSGLSAILVREVLFNILFWWGRPTIQEHLPEFKEPFYSTLLSAVFSGLVIGLVTNPFDLIAAKIRENPELTIKSLLRDSTINELFNGWQFRIGYVTVAIIALSVSEQLINKEHEKMKKEFAL